jgi:hypothetical protein
MGKNRKFWKRFNKIGLSSSWFFNYFGKINQNRNNLFFFLQKKRFLGNSVIRFSKNFIKLTNYFVDVNVFYYLKKNIFF